MIKVMVIGSKGKMGSETVKAIQNDSGLDLVSEVELGQNLNEVIQKTTPDVAVDFTHPGVVKDNLNTLIDAGVHAVVGTTGLSVTDREELHRKALTSQVRVAICPNFAIGAVLLMKHAAEISKYMTKAEIIEFHHDKKADAPSGTALQTSHLIAEANPAINATPLEEKEILSGVRGGRDGNIPIHSVRLEGFIASQEVIFGDVGQTLTLRHDTVSRSSFMPGVVLAVKKILGSESLNGIIYGLEKLL